jgi:hypothetical protein
VRQRQQGPQEIRSTLRPTWGTVQFTNFWVRLWSRRLVRTLRTSHQFKEMGRSSLAAPRTDPCERNYRRRLLPRMNSVKTYARIRMESTGTRYPSVESWTNLIPARTTPLTGTPKDAAPQRAEPIAESAQRSQVVGYSMIAIKAVHDSRWVRPVRSPVHTAVEVL